MEASILVPVIIALLAGLWVVRRSLGVPSPSASSSVASTQPVTSSASATASDASGIAAAMLRSDEEPRFAAFCPDPPNGPAATEGVINLHLGVENGAIGLDWVLEAPRNVSTAEEVHRFIESRGFVVAHHEVNEVRYLRTEGADVASLATELLVDLFELDPSESMYLVVEGFEWPPHDRLRTGAGGAG